MMNNDKKLTFLERLKLNFNNQKVSFDDLTKKKVRRQRFFALLGTLLRTFILIGLCFVILLPIFQKFSFALRHPTDITDPQVVWIPKAISPINFQIARDLLNFGTTIINSSILSLVTMIIQIIATAIAGYSFARLKFKGNNILFFFIVFTLVVPYETLHVSRIQFLTNTSFFGMKLIGNIFSI